MSDISRLPKWAQEKIKGLERQREEAVKALNLFVDQQTPSPVSFQQFNCIGEGPGPSFKTAYVQTNSLTITWAGIVLNIFLPTQKDPQRFYGIELSWTGEKSRYVAMLPRTHQGVELIAKENLP